MKKPTENQADVSRELARHLFAGGTVICDEASTAKRILEWLVKEEQLQGQAEVERLRAELRKVRTEFCPIWDLDELIGEEQYADDSMHYDAGTDRLCGEPGSVRTREEYIHEFREINSGRFGRRRKPAGGEK